MNDGSGMRTAPRPIAAIVVIADDSIWRSQTAQYLHDEGFDVTVGVGTGVAFDKHAGSADAAIIDLGLRAGSGAQACLAWTSRTKAPVIAVARATDESTVLNAYAAGADRFAPMDVPPRLLLAHLRSMLRRFPPRAPVNAAMRAMPVRLDEQRRCAVVLGTSIPLMDQEFEILKLLVHRAGRIVTRAELIGVLFPGSPRNSKTRAPSRNGRAVDFIIRRLRRDLESVDPRRRIVAVRGVGFRFETGAEVDPAPISESAPSTSSGPPGGLLSGSARGHGGDALPTTVGGGLVS